MPGAFIRCSRCGLIGRREAICALCRGAVKHSQTDVSPVARRLLALLQESPLSCAALAEKVSRIGVVVADAMKDLEHLGYVIAQPSASLVAPDAVRYWITETGRDALEGSPEPIASPHSVSQKPLSSTILLKRLLVMKTAV